MTLRQLGEELKNEMGYEMEEYQLGLPAGNYIRFTHQDGENLGIEGEPEEIIENVNNIDHITYDKENYKVNIILKEVDFLSEENVYYTLDLKEHFIQYFHIK